MSRAPGTRATKRVVVSSRAWRTLTTLGLLALLGAAGSCANTGHTSGPSLAGALFGASTYTRTQPFNGSPQSNHTPTWEVVDIPPPTETPK